MANATPECLKTYLRGQLSYFKVLEHIAIVSELPKTSMGKAQRLGMAEKLGMVGNRDFPGHTAEYASPSTNIEYGLASIWSDVLHVDHIGIDDNFFDLGGDSLAVASLFVKIEQIFKRKLPINTIFISPTPRQMAQVIDGSDERPLRGSPIELRKGAGRPPLFCLHNAGGGLIEYEGFVKELHKGRMVYGLQPPIRDGVLEPLGNIGAIASYYIKEIKAIQPVGPYYLLGYCFGGAIAYEMAWQLYAMGDTVGFLGLIEYVAPAYHYRPDFRSVKMLAGRCTLVLSNVARAPRGKRLREMQKIPLALGEFIRSVYKSALSPHKAPLNVKYPAWVTNIPESGRDLCMFNYRAFREYLPREYAGQVTLFISRDTDDGLHNLILNSPGMGWEKYVTGDVTTLFIPGDHNSIIQKPNVEELARKVEECLEVVDTGLGAKYPPGS